jgi:hypothetical protein
MRSHHGHDRRFPVDPQDGRRGCVRRRPVNGPAERLRRIAGVVQALGEPDPLPGLCRATVPVLAVSGAGLMMSAGEAPAVHACWGEVSGYLQELQRATGQGPCRDAHDSGRPVSEPDLGRLDPDRWPGFAAPARQAGVVAIFSFPMRVGAVRLGALTVHRSRPGGLSDEQDWDARMIAGIAATAILRFQAGAPAGTVGRELTSLVDHDAVVHQATGMASAQLEVPLAEASVRLRAHAFATGIPLTDVARDIVARRLRLDR